MSNKSYCPNCDGKLFLFFLKKKYVCPHCQVKLLTNINNISFLLILFMSIAIAVTQLLLMTGSRILFTMEVLIIFYLSKLIGERLIKVELYNDEKNGEQL